MTNSHKITLLLLTAISPLMIMPLYSPTLIQDTAWLMVAAERIMNGAIIGEGVDEPVPPWGILTYLPPKILGGALSDYELGISLWIGIVTTFSALLLLPLSKALGLSFSARLKKS